MSTLENSPVLPETINVAQLTELLALMLENRMGEVITRDLAYERARNMAAALNGLSVVEK
jgi:hypothetical protein